MINISFVEIIARLTAESFNDARYQSSFLGCHNKKDRARASARERGPDE
jgi:hypothetical protein